MIDLSSRVARGSQIVALRGPLRVTRERASRLRPQSPELNPTARFGRCFPASLFPEIECIRQRATDLWLSVATRTIRCRNGASMPHCEDGERRRRGTRRPSNVDLAWREKIRGRATSSLRRTPIRKLQDRRAKEFDAGDTHSDSRPEEFDRGPSNSLRLKPTLPKKLHFSNAHICRSCDVTAYRTFKHWPSNTSLNHPPEA
jgi:hypothetical protein